MNVNSFISAKNAGISPDRSFFDKSLYIEERKIAKLLSFSQRDKSYRILSVRVSNAYNSLNFVSLDISGVMVPVNSLAVRFLMFKVDPKKLKLVKKKTRKIQIFLMINKQNIQGYDKWWVRVRITAV